MGPSASALPKGLSRSAAAKSCSVMSDRVAVELAEAEAQALVVSHHPIGTAEPSGEAAEALCSWQGGREGTWRATEQRGEERRMREKRWAEGNVVFS